MMPSTAQVIATSSGCIVLLPLVRWHSDHGSQPRRCNTPPAVSCRRIPRSAAHRRVSRLWHPPVFGGGWGLAPRGRARHVPASAHQPSGAERVAMAGKPRIEETCQGAHAQSRPYSTEAAMRTFPVQ